MLLTILASVSAYNETTHPGVSSLEMANLLGKMPANCYFHPSYERLIRAAVLDAKNFEAYKALELTMRSALLANLPGLTTQQGKLRNATADQTDATLKNIRFDFFMRIKAYCEGWYPAPAQDAVKQKIVTELASWGLPADTLKDLERCCNQTAATAQPTGEDLIRLNEIHKTATKKELGADTFQAKIDKICDDLKAYMVSDETDVVLDKEARMLRRLTEMQEKLKMVGATSIAAATPKIKESSLKDLLSIYFPVGSSTDTSPIISILLPLVTTENYTSLSAFITNALVVLKSENQPLNQPLKDKLIDSMQKAQSSEITKLQAILRQGLAELFPAPQSGTKDSNYWSSVATRLKGVSYTQLSMMIHSIQFLEVENDALLKRASMPFATKEGVEIALKVAKIALPTSQPVEKQSSVLRNLFKSAVDLTKIAMSSVVSYTWGTTVEEKDPQKAKDLAINIYDTFIENNKDRILDTLFAMTPIVITDYSPTASQLLLTTKGPLWNGKVPNEKISGLEAYAWLSLVDPKELEYPFDPKTCLEALKTGILIGLAKNTGTDDLGLQSKRLIERLAPVMTALQKQRDEVEQVKATVVKK